MLQPEEGSKKTDCICFYSLQDRRIYEFNNVPKDLTESRCVGSSHGWLVFQDKRAIPYLLNIFSRARIQLPPKQTLFPHGESTVSGFQKRVLINKAVLSSSPSRSNNYAVITIYCMNSRLGFFKNGDSEWIDLQGKFKRYSDIFCSDNNKLYALGSSQKGCMEVWDFNNTNYVPIKTISMIQPSFVDITSEPSISLLGDVYNTRGYLVESRGDVLLVMRYVGHFARVGKSPIPYHDIMAREPDQIYGFGVYKLDLDQKTWSEVEYFSDLVLFLGQNQNLVLLSGTKHPECNKNSIYFTDNYWRIMDEDDEYDDCYDNRHMGIFNLEYGSVQVVYDGDHVLRLKSPPLWLVP